MAHAQIELYPADTHLERDESGEVLSSTPIAPWGWRKVVLVEPPEVLEDSGLVFADRQEAFGDALEKHPAWPIG